jgi:hypothetical protein
LNRMSLLIAGGESDPNLQALSAAGKRLGIPLVELRHGQGKSPAFQWDIDSGSVKINGESCRPHAAFIRHDVFEGLNDPRPEIGTRALAWYQAVHGWLLVDRTIRLFNRDSSVASMNKTTTLVAARDAGLAIPATVVTNLESAIREAATRGDVTKPVAGGDYCYPLDEVLSRTEFRNGVSSCPGFLQPRLVAPEVRIYVIGSKTFAFEMRSPSLDYRMHQDVDVIPLPEVPNAEEGLRRLMTHLRMDYGAADFKSDPQSGELVFLELNTSPMFARFDQQSRGELCLAMIGELMDC